MRAELRLWSWCWFNHLLFLLLHCHSSIFAICMLKTWTLYLDWLWLVHPSSNPVCEIYMQSLRNGKSAFSAQPYFVKTWLKTYSKVPKFLKEPEGTLPSRVTYFKQQIVLEVRISFCLYVFVPRRLSMVLEKCDNNQKFTGPEETRCP